MSIFPTHCGFPLFASLHCDTATKLLSVCLYTAAALGLIALLVVAVVLITVSSLLEPTITSGGEFIQNGYELAPIATYGGDATSVMLYSVHHNWFGAKLSRCAQIRLPNSNDTHQSSQSAVVSH